MMRNLWMVSIALSGCGGSTGATIDCPTAPPLTFSACPNAPASPMDPRAPIIDRFEGPSCIANTKSGAYHLVFHDGDDRVTTLRIAGPEYPIPASIALTPGATFDGTVNIVPGKDPADYAMQITLLDEAGHESLPMCGLVKVR
jgi:hypothetical protein